MARCVTVSGGENWAKLPAESKSSFQVGLIFRQRVRNEATKRRLASRTGNKDEAGIAASDFTLNDADPFSAQHIGVARKGRLDLLGRKVKHRKWPVGDHISGRAHQEGGGQHAAGLH